MGAIAVLLFALCGAEALEYRLADSGAKVLIADGGTTVIGGIFVVNEGEAETRVPWFRKIPVFGWLFRNQEITQENRELLIFISPKIMKLS